MKTTLAITVAFIIGVTMTASVRASNYLSDSQLRQMVGGVCVQCDAPTECQQVNNEGVCENIYDHETGAFLGSGKAFRTQGSYFLCGLHPATGNCDPNADSWNCTYTLLWTAKDCAGTSTRQDGTPTPCCSVQAVACARTLLQSIASN